MMNRVKPYLGTKGKNRLTADDAVDAWRGVARKPISIAEGGGAALSHPDVDPAFRNLLSGKSVPTPPSTSSSSYPPSPATAKAPQNNGLYPAAIIGGIASAGMGAAALEQYKDKREHTPSMVENAATGVLGGMDKVVSTASTAMSMIEMPLAPIAMGGMALSMLGTPVAHGINKLGFKAPLQGVEWASNKLQRIQEATFSEVGNKISPALGRKVENAVQSTVKAAAPVLDKVSHAPGLGGLHSTHLKTASKTLANTSAFNGVWQATWVGGAAIQNYMVAREFGTQVYTLRRLQAKLTNKDISEVSSLSVLTGSVEKPVAIARSQLLKISSAHAFASIAGLGMALKSNWINQKLGGVAGKIGFGGGIANMALMMATFSGPAKVSEVVEGMVGEPILAAYSAMQDAEDAGHKFTAEEYAGFVFAASESLRNRGRVGQEMALKLGAQYTAEGLSLAGILKEVHGPEMNARVEQIIAANAAEKKAAPAADTSHTARIEQERKMVSPVMRKKEMEAVGPMTEMLKQQAAATPTQQVL